MHCDFCSHCSNSTQGPQYYFLEEMVLVVLRRTRSETLATKRLMIIAEVRQLSPRMVTSVDMLHSRALFGVSSSSFVANNEFEMVFQTTRKLDVQFAAGIACLLWVFVLVAAVASFLKCRGSLGIRGGRLSFLMQPFDFRKLRASCASPIRKPHLKPALGGLLGCADNERLLGSNKTVPL